MFLENRLQDLTDALLAELHLHELVHAAELLLGLRSDIVDFIRQQFLLPVVEIDQHRGHIFIRQLALLAEPAAHVAAADEGGEDGVGLGAQERDDLRRLLDEMEV